MATSSEKIVELIKNKVGLEIPEKQDGESVMQDETGYVFLHLVISVHKDIIEQAGYYASEEIPVDLAAAMAAVTELIRGKAIMSAALISREDIEKPLSDDGNCSPETMRAVDTALLMLRECLRNYSMKYNALRQERLSRKDI